MSHSPTPAELLARVSDTMTPPMERLERLMAILRSPEGCAWDRKQTHQTLIPYLIEECYEVVDVIAAANGGESGLLNAGELREELGDLLVQIAFHAQLAAERGEFTLQDVAAAVVEKLVRRHPHVFAKTNAIGAEHVREQWEQRKSRERATDGRSLLDGLPASMPALTRAFRMGEKAGGVGFDWPDATGAREKITEELAEIDAVRQEGADKDRLTGEIGDLLFAVASFARKSGIDPEQALRRSLDSFTHRFQLMEQQVRQAGKEMGEYTLDELEALWEEAKKPGPA